jgi:hypothetical protein
MFFGDGVRSSALCFVGLTESCAVGLLVGFFAFCEESGWLAFGFRVVLRDVFLGEFVGLNGRFVVGSDLLAIDVGVRVGCCQDCVGL